MTSKLHWPIFFAKRKTNKKKRVSQRANRFVENIDCETRRPKIPEIVSSSIFRHDLANSPERNDASPTGRSLITGFFKKQAGGAGGGGGSRQLGKTRGNESQKRHPEKRRSVVSWHGYLGVTEALPGAEAVRRDFMYRRECFR